MKKRRNNGFTLAELLIVVAIIAVLVSISIPIFAEELEKGREATDAANIRSEYAQMMSEVVADEYDYSTEKGKYVVDLKQTGDDWITTFDFPSNTKEIGIPSKGGKATLYYKNDIAYIDYGDSSETKYNTTLISGYEFNAKIPSNTTSIVFTKSAVPDSVTDFIDLSSTGDGGVVGYMDGTTFTVSPKEDGATIYAPEDCTRMFSGEDNPEVRFVTSIDLSNLDTSKSTNMDYMFHAAMSVKELNLTNFDTSNVTSMAFMFSTCRNLLSLKQDFNTSNVVNMDFMFYLCNKFKSLDLTNFDTSNVEEMDAMFFECHALETLDLSSFDFTKCRPQDVQCAMFRMAVKLATIYVKDETAYTFVEKVKPIRRDGDLVTSVIIK